MTEEITKLASKLQDELAVGKVDNGTLTKLGKALVQGADEVRGSRINAKVSALKAAGDFGSAVGDIAVRHNEVSLASAFRAECTALDGSLNGLRHPDLAPNVPTERVIGWAKEALELAAQYEALLGAAVAE